MEEPPWNPLYWQAVVQVIPVLALALIIEFRGIEKPWRRTDPGTVPRLLLRGGATIFHLLVGTGMAASEVYALGALASPEGTLDGQFPSLLSFASVVLGLFLVILIPFYRSRPYGPPPEGMDRRKRTGRK